MKTILQTIRKCGIIAAISAFQLTNGFCQSEATTDPVGFIDLTVLGGGTLASPKYSLISPTLTQPISWQGAITTVATTSGHTTITVSGVQWADNQFNGASGAHYVEIISTTTPANTGVLAAITSSAAGATNSTITTNENLSGLASVGDSIRIRKEVTIGDIFGTSNTAGLLASDDPSTADEVLVYDGAASIAYFYFTGAPGYPAGWYDSAFGLAPGAGAKIVVGPHQGLVVKRKAAEAVTFTMSGAVKSGNTLFPVVTGINVLGTASAKGLTLATSGLYTGSNATGLKGSDDPSTADEVTIYAGGTQTNYFYFTGAPGYAAGWYDSAFALAPGVGNNIAIAPGTAFVVNRKGGASFNWALPSPTSF